MLGTCVEMLRLDQTSTPRLRPDIKRHNQNGVGPKQACLTAPYKSASYFPRMTYTLIAHRQIAFGMDFEYVLTSSNERDKIEKPQQ